MRPRVRPHLPHKRQERLISVAGHSCPRRRRRRRRRYIYSRRCLSWRGRSSGVTAALLPEEDAAVGEPIYKCGGRFCCLSSEGSMLSPFAVVVAPTALCRIDAVSMLSRPPIFICTLDEMDLDPGSSRLDGNGRRGPSTSSPSRSS